MHMQSTLLYIIIFFIFRVQRQFCIQQPLHFTQAVEMFYDPQYLPIIRTIAISPADIRYSSRDIGQCFRNGTSLTETFRQILYGQVKLDEIERLTVFEYRGALWLLTGHRRLFLYKHLQSLGCLSTIIVNVTYSPHDMGLYGWVCVVKYYLHKNLYFGRMPAHRVEFV